MNKWHAMTVFVEVSELKSFAEAGRHFHMSPPAVSRTISALEAEIGARLLIRTTRFPRSARTPDRRDYERLGFIRMEI